MWIGNGLGEWKNCFKVEFERESNEPTTCHVKGMLGELVSDETRPESQIIDGCPLAKGKTYNGGAG